MNSRIVDAYGRPFSILSSNGNGSATKIRSTETLTTLNSFIEGLGLSRQSAQYRARNPFEHHAWVYAAAMAVATTASQAPKTK